MLAALEVTVAIGSGTGSRNAIPCCPAPVGEPLPGDFSNRVEAAASKVEMVRFHHSYRNQMARSTGSRRRLICSRKVNRMCTDSQSGVVYIPSQTARRGTSSIIDSTVAGGAGADREMAVHAGNPNSPAAEILAMTHNATGYTVLAGNRAVKVGRGLVHPGVRMGVRELADAALIVAAENQDRCEDKQNE